MSDLSSRKYKTRHLNPENMPYQEPRRGTGPLEYAMPWVIELRVVGTPSVLEVQVNEAMLIGRYDDESDKQPDIDLKPYDGHQRGVSRSHAMLYARNSRITLRDLNSSNGTFINGGRLQPGEQYRVRHGDTIAFGRLSLQVFFVVTPSSYEKNSGTFDEIRIPKLGNGQRILILEDDAKVAHAVGSILEQAGFSYEWKQSVTEALVQVEQQMPDVILTELIMPERSGIELINHVRNQTAGAKLPIIVMSSASGGYQMGQALEAGADVYLYKPVGIDELLSALYKVINPSSSTGYNRDSGVRQSYMT